MTTKRKRNFVIEQSWLSHITFDTQERLACRCVTILNRQFFSVDETAATTGFRHDHRNTRPTRSNKGTSKGKSTSVRCGGADKGIPAVWVGYSRSDATRKTMQLQKQRPFSMEVPFPALPITHTSRCTHNCSRHDYTSDRVVSKGRKKIERKQLLTTKGWVREKKENEGEIDGGSVKERKRERELFEYNCNSCRLVGRWTDSLRD